jgi:fused signal recognition particle receptor
MRPKLSRLRRGLTKTRDLISKGLTRIAKGDDNDLTALEETLVRADIGPRVAAEMVDALKSRGRFQSEEELRSSLEQVLREKLNGSGPLADASPTVIMVVGVNGSGKTTTIGKLASRYIADGKKVLLAAADTFRAAAVEQLDIWADRTGADIIKAKYGADPASVTFDAVSAGLSRDVDVIIIDTAGRLHTQKNLMEELKKVKRVIAKKLPGAPHEILLVLDSTVGQNGLNQAKVFHEALGVTGIVLAKLDGTAKGGIAVAISSELGVPVKLVGVGEGVDDLVDFDPDEFVSALVS